ncbi:MAG: type I glyceraldehyde-3-phosphate dehydrogenase [Desulfococcaceae bacterium]
MMKIAINGLGRIGRAVLKQVIERPEMELLAVNELNPADNIAYLLKYDSVYGRYDKSVNVDEQGRLVVNGKPFRTTQEKDPAALDWKSLDIDLVFECTGVFRKKPDLEKHLEAGARHVLLSAPEKTGEVPMIVHGVNKLESPSTMLSTASCTTNCIAPVAEVMSRRVGVVKAAMTTIHAYTASQSVIDGPKKKWRRGRAAAVNFVPTTTGAAEATTKILPDLAGRFDGAAVRGPVPSGSLTDITFLVNRSTSVEEINGIFEEEANGDRYRGILGVSHDPLVSSDIIGDSRASVVDLNTTQVIDGDLVKLMSWYDNEWGYASQMVREAGHMLEGKV